MPTTGSLSSVTCETHSESCVLAVLVTATAKSIDGTPSSVIAPDGMPIAVRTAAVDDDAIVNGTVAEITRHLLLAPPSCALNPVSVENVTLSAARKADELAKLLPWAKVN